MDGGPGLAMERLEGTDLLSVLGQKPWLVFRSGRLTGEIHARINGARAPASLPTVREVMRDALARLAHREPAALADCAARILGRLPDGEALCHGDVHPGQLILSNGQCAAFDCVGAKRGAAFLFDYARTRVLLRRGEPPPGTQLPLDSLPKWGASF